MRDTFDAFGHAVVLVPVAVVLCQQKIFPLCPVKKCSWRIAVVPDNGFEHGLIDVQVAFLRVILAPHLAVALILAVESAWIVGTETHEPVVAPEIDVCFGPACEVRLDVLDRQGILVLEDGLRSESVRCEDDGGRQHLFVMDVFLHQFVVELLLESFDGIYNFVLSQHGYELRTGKTIVFLQRS